MSTSIDTSDILVVIDKGDQHTISLQPPDQYGVSIKSGDTYVVNIDLPTVITTQQTGSYFRIADFATSSSYALTASYIAGDAGVTDWTEITNKPSGLISSSNQVSYTGLNNVPSGILSSSTQINQLSNVSASFALTASYVVGDAGITDWTEITNKPLGLVSSSTQINTGSFSGSFVGAFQTKQINLEANNKVITIEGTTLTNIFAETANVDPLISAITYSGASIEYNAQRTGAARFGKVMASWSGSNLVYTDNSTNDIGDTSDLSFNLIKIGNDIRFRAYSEGLGTGTWNISFTFTLFPNLL